MCPSKASPPISVGICRASNIFVPTYPARHQCHHKPGLGQKRPVDSRGDRCPSPKNLHWVIVTPSMSPSMPKSVPTELRSSHSQPIKQRGFTYDRSQPVRRLFDGRQILFTRAALSQSGNIKQLTPHRQLTRSYSRFCKLISVMQRSVAGRGSGGGGAAQKDAARNTADESPL